MKAQTRYLAFVIMLAGAVSAFGVEPAEGGDEEKVLFEGTVLSPTGEPLAGAEVALGSPENQVTLSAEGSAPALMPERRIVRTDQAGRYSLPADPEGVALVFVHKQGYAKIVVDDFPPPPEVRLAPWATVEGVVMTGSAPGRGTLVKVGDPRLGGSRVGLGFYIEARGDEQGRFRFDWVPPGPRSIDRYVRTGERSWTRDRGVRIEAKPGESVEVRIGGEGRPVVGKVVPDDPEREIDWRAGLHHLETKLPDSPGEFANQMEYDRWMRSDEMRRARAEQLRFAVLIDEDGMFRVEDVPEGDYSLSITLHERSQGGAASSQRIGALTQEVTVPEMTEGRNDEPLDLGVLTFSLDWNRENGDAAPEFEFPSLDGETYRLSDFQGKYVLLDFWATWCGPCVEETPNLKETYEAFGGDRFEIIALSIDVNRDAPRQYARENNLEWVQGYLGWETKVAGRFGVHGIPAYFLIDPEGKIVAHGMRGEAIKAEVAKALRGRKGSKH